MAFRVYCEWFGVKAAFTVPANTSGEALAAGRQRCRKETGLPPAAVRRTVFIKPTARGKAARKIISESP